MAFVAEEAVGESVGDVEEERMPMQQRVEKRVPDGEGQD